MGTRTIYRVRYALLASLTSVSIIIFGLIYRAGANPVPGNLAISSFDQSNRGEIVTAANSLSFGDPFNSVSKSSGTTMHYVEAPNNTSPLDDAVRITTNSNSNHGYVKWNKTTLGERSELYSSMQLRINSIPENNVRLVVYSYLPDSSTTSTITGYVMLQGTGTSNPGALRLCDVGSTHCTYTSSAVPTDRWVRIDSRLFADQTNGSMTVKLFNNVQDTTATSSVTLSPTAINPWTNKAFGTINTATSEGLVSGVGFGVNNDVDANIWIDELKVNKDDYPSTANTTPWYITNDFESGFSTFNVVNNGAIDTSAPITGTKSAKFNATSVKSNAAMTAANLMPSKRATKVSFKFSYTDAGNPDIAQNIPVLTVRNSNVTSAGGGGHFNMWVEAAAGVNHGTLRGDLQAPNNFSSGYSILPNTTYDFDVYVHYAVDWLSYAKVRINGTEVASITSSTVDTAVTTQQSIAPLLRKVIIGSESINPDYEVKYDDFSITTNNMYFTPW